MITYRNLNPGKTISHLMNLIVSTRFLVSIAILTVFSFSLSESFFSNDRPKPCRGARNCTSNESPTEYAFNMVNNIYDSQGDILNFGAADIDSSYIDSFSLIEFYNNKVGYPYVPFEFIYEKENESDTIYDNAIKQICPCDPSLVLLDWNQLQINEKTQLKADNADKKSNGGGNMIISLPSLESSVGFGHDDPRLISPIPWNSNGKRMDRKPIIAILDTGLESAFLDSLSSSYQLRDAQSFVFDTVNSVYTPVNFDSTKHGTMITSIIQHASNGNAEFLIYKTHDKNGNGTVFSIRCALRCAKQEGANIVNMSFGGYVKHSGLAAELDSIAKDSNIVLIASTGNHGKKVGNINSQRDEYHTPSDHEYTIAVSGLETDLVVLSNSTSGQDSEINFKPMPDVRNSARRPRLWKCANYSPAYISLAASAIIRDERDPGPPKTAEGTSFSAAYISGRISNYLYTNGQVNWNYKYLKANYLDVKEIKCNRKRGEGVLFKTVVPDVEIN